MTSGEHIQHNTEPLKIQDVSGKEMRAIELLTALHMYLEAYEPNMKDRLRSIPGGYRDWRLVMAKAYKLCDRIYDTMPHDKQLKLLNSVKNSELVVRPLAATRPHDSIIADSGAVRTLIYAITDHLCSMCVKEGADVRKCELRKAMRSMATPNRVAKGEACEFAAYAAGLTEEDK